MGAVRILYGGSTISLQAAVHPKCILGALNMKEEEYVTFSVSLRIFKDMKREGFYSFSWNIYCV